jgi:hypothetical protein
MWMGTAQSTSSPRKPSPRRGRVSQYNQLANWMARSPAKLAASQLQFTRTPRGLSPLAQVVSITNHEREREGW